MSLDTVYDLTTFVSDHPGGVDALHSCAGTDGTEAYDYASHSKSNMNKMQQYLIGTLDGYTHEQSDEEPQITKRLSSPKGNTKKLSWQPLVGITVSGVSALVLYSSSLGRHSASRTLPMPSLQIASGGAVFFGAGVALASAISCAGFYHVYKVYQCSLDYQNDVFSFPPVIPRKSRK